MKTERQVMEKLQECEERIYTALEEHCNDLSIWVRLKTARSSLLWMLSSDDRITPDELTAKIDFEILCIESSELF